MTPRNNKNWNFSVFIFGSISSRNVDPGSCTHAGRRKRGAVVAAHPGVVGDEEETSEKAPALRKKVARVDVEEGLG
jgi:hypothetical protein